MNCHFTAPPPPAHLRDERTFLTLRPLCAEMHRVATHLVIAPLGHRLVYRFRGFRLCTDFFADLRTHRPVVRDLRHPERQPFFDLGEPPRDFRVYVPRECTLRDRRLRGTDRARFIGTHLCASTFDLRHPLAHLPVERLRMYDLPACFRIDRDSARDFEYRRRCDDRRRDDDRRRERDPRFDGTHLCGSVFEWR